MLKFASSSCDVEVTSDAEFKEVCEKINVLVERTTRTEKLESGIKRVKSPTLCNFECLVLYFLLQPK